jgi:hypothetical protein
MGRRKGGKKQERELDGTFAGRGVGEMGESRVVEGSRRARKFWNRKSP